MFRKSGPMAILAAFIGFFLVLFLVFEVLDTEFFRGDPDRGGEATPTRNERTALAHAYCARDATRRLDLDEAGTRALPDYTAWDMGFDRYLVRARLERTDDPVRTRQYLCKIVFQAGPGSGGGDWQVQSIDFVQ